MTTAIKVSYTDVPFLTSILEKIEKHSEMQQRQVERFEEAKHSLEILASTWKRLSTLNLDEMNPAIVRNAEMMSHFLQMAREADTEAALHLNITQSFKESLTLFLAEKYHIDITKEWELDLEQRALSYK